MALPQENHDYLSSCSDIARREDEHILSALRSAAEVLDRNEVHYYDRMFILPDGTVFRGPRSWRGRMRDLSFRIRCFFYRLFS